jgi:hypothetical protein
MKLQILCEEHDDFVVPAGDEFHWLPPSFSRGMYTLDVADLYCLGGEGEHKFIALIYDDDGSTLHANIYL